MDELARIEGVYGCVAEYNRSRFEDEEHECDLRLKSQKRYAVNRKKLDNAKMVLLYGGCDKCVNCPYADHDTQIDYNDDTEAVICNAPDDKTDCEKLNYERLPYTHAVVRIENSQNYAISYTKSYQEAFNYCESKKWVYDNGINTLPLKIEQIHINRIEPLKESSSEEMKRVINEIREANEYMKFFNNKVSPYGFAITVESMVESAESFANCTLDSRQVLKDEINGLVNTINTWIDTYNEPKVQVKIILGEKAGVIQDQPNSIAVALVEMGFAENVSF